MKYQFKFLALPIILSLGACSSSSTGTNSLDSLDIISISGKTISLDGSYVYCKTINVDPPLSEEYAMDFSGTNLSITQTELSSLDCSGTSLGENFSLTATISKGDIAAIEGWVNRNDEPTKPPLADNGTGPLSNNETVTLLNTTITDSTDITDIGITFELFFVVDDTGDVPLLYEDDDNDLTGRLAVSQNPLSKI